MLLTDNRTDTCENLADSASLHHKFATECTHSHGNDFHSDCLSVSRTSAKVTDKFRWNFRSE